MSLQLPPNCKLFTADASSMYTNIPTRTAITKISKWLKDNQRTVPRPAHQGSPQGTDSHYGVGASSTSVTPHGGNSGHCNGSPPAPPYATIYFAILESILLRSFMDSLAVSAALQEIHR
ncbi:hypothetical protein SEMRO_35_G022360.1 [Seminavis robusta]|uniref:Uncharacterized protein n=1 Tax=Seminavis robusta TaxID=568900 RepID=A0A9N8D8D1_9STRA|nr:hypothetical protein SEMRO_35_G022360.1 [Seminavis robusta]|eukprot:Sro35_g022360.1 n/a (119) ;mRNA; r:79662-80018